MYNLAKLNDSDDVYYGIIGCNENGNYSESLYIGKDGGQFTIYDSGINFMNDMLKYHRIRTGSSNFFKRKLLENNKIKFTEGAYIDDIEFTLNLFNTCRKITYIRKAIYVYCYRRNSITQSHVGVDFWTQYFDTLSRVINDIKNDNINVIWDKLYEYLSISCIHAYKMMDDECKKKFEENLQINGNILEQFKYMKNINLNKGQYFNIPIEKIDLLKQIGKKLYIYGAGEYAKDLYWVLESYSIEIVGFIESNPSIDKTYMNKKVYNLIDIDINNSLILIGVSEKYYDEILAALNDRGYEIFML
jgi:hypothetical protein